MNKAELIKAIAERTGEKKRVIEAVLFTYECVLSDALHEGDQVALQNFGTFSTRLRKSYMGHNPKTMEPILIPEKRVVKFSPHRRFRERAQ